VNEMMDKYRARLKRIDEAECLDGEWDDTSSDDDIVKREDFPRGCDVMTRDGKCGSVVQVNYDFEDPDKVLKLSKSYTLKLNYDIEDPDKVLKLSKSYTLKLNYDIEDPDKVLELSKSYTSNTRHQTTNTKQ
jgi:hypothetical protein